MNTKSLILHQLKCEWLSFRCLVALWSIALVWCGWMLFSWDEPWLAYNDRGIRNEDGLPYVVIAGFAILFAISIFKRDDYRNVRSFWQTRPMRETPLHLAKFIFFQVIVALPATLLFFINIWMYDSLTMAIFSGLELFAWLLLGMSLIALLTQHSSGLFSFIKPTLSIGVIFIISLLAISAWIHFISNQAYLSRDHSTDIVIYTALTLLSLAFCWLWLRQATSRRKKTHLKHYLIIPVILVSSQASIDFILDSMSTPPQKMSLQTNRNIVEMNPEKLNYRGEITIQLKGNKNEYLHRIIGQNLRCDSDDIRLSISDSNSSAASYNFSPNEVSKGRKSLNYEPPIDYYRDINFRFSTPLGKPIPKQVRITGYCYVELTKAEEVLNAPYTESAVAKSNGMEFAWRQKSAYHNIENLFIKRASYPFLSYSYAKPSYIPVHSITLRNDKLNEYRSVELGSNHAAGYASQHRRSSEFNSKHNHYSQREQSIAEWRQTANLSIWQLQPSRIVKIPVDMTIDLVIKTNR